MRYILLGFLLLHLGYGQTLPLQVITRLPAFLNETSGAVCPEEGKIWLHNDSGDNPFLYLLNQQGVVTRQLTLDSAQHVDWEDMTKDDQGNLYLADAGNNNNDRQDLVIYRIPNPDSLASDTLIPERIFFSYPEQDSFPPADEDRNYDLEAVVWLKDSLHLFTKNRTDPYTGFTRHYRLSDQPGTYQAALVDSFYTGPAPRETSWVTGAAVSPGKNHLVLLGHNKLWVFSCFDGSDFFSGFHQEISLETFSQKEAICFATSNKLYITDEQLIILPPQWYEVDLFPAFDPTSLDLGADTSVADSIILDIGLVPADQILWSTGDTTKTLRVISSGTYSVEVTRGNCVARDTISIMVSPLSIPSELPQQQEFGISSTPSGYQLVLAPHLQFEAFDITIFTTDGKLVKSFSSELAPGEQAITLPDDLPTGTYLVRIQGGNPPTWIKWGKQF
ncbi:MAG: T9SS type A sorting domain-containing protein [Bacteroidota bacterium]